MSRRRKPTPQERYIWEELDRISETHYSACRAGEEPVEARTAWQRLWEKTAAGEKFAAVPIESAGYLSWWGWRLAMEEWRHDAALELISAYFPHPGIEQENA